MELTPAQIKNYQSHAKALVEFLMKNEFHLVLAGVEDIEELLLHLGFLGQTVDVVHQQDIHVPHGGAEFGEALVLGQQFVEIVEHLVAGGAADADLGGLAPHVGGDGLEQVRFADAVGLLRYALRAG